MQLVQLIIPAEAAHDTVYQLGEVRSPRVAVHAPCRTAARTALVVHTPLRYVCRHHTWTLRAATGYGRAARTGRAPQTGGQRWARLPAR